MEIYKLHSARARFQGETRYFCVWYIVNNFFLLQFLFFFSRFRCVYLKVDDEINETCLIAGSSAWEISDSEFFSFNKQQQNPANVFSLWKWIPRKVVKLFTMFLRRDPTEWRIWSMKCLKDVWNFTTHITVTSQKIRVRITRLNSFTQFSVLSSWLLLFYVYVYQNMHKLHR